MLDTAKPETLLDVNNIYVSAHNHGYSAADFLDGIPFDRVRQVHLAGHTDGYIKIDTHDQPVCEGVWDLYAKAMERLGPVATMIERDDNIPSFDMLYSELQQAKVLFTDCLGQPATAPCEAFQREKAAQ